MPGLARNLSASVVLRTCFVYRSEIGSSSSFLRFTPGGGFAPGFSGDDRLGRCAGTCPPWKISLWRTCGDIPARVAGVCDTSRDTGTCPGSPARRIVEGSPPVPAALVKCTRRRSAPRGWMTGPPVEATMVLDDAGLPVTVGCRVVCSGVGVGMTGGVGIARLLSVTMVSGCSRLKNSLVPAKDLLGPPRSTSLAGLASAGLLQSPR